MQSNLSCLFGFHELYETKTTTRIVCCRNCDYAFFGYDGWENETFKQREEQFERTARHMKGERCRN